MSDDDIAALGGGDAQVGHEILGGMFRYMITEPGVIPSWTTTIIGGW
jgi:hypothetical protein